MRAGVRARHSHTSAMPPSLTESLLLGNVALRSGSAVEWDPVKMLVTNNPSAAAFIKPEFRAGWSL